MGRILLEPRVARGERGGDSAADSPGALHDVVPKRAGARDGGRAMNYRSSYFILTCIGIGFAFLYIPILSMVVFSFNASKLVTVWDSAHSPTLKWYYSLLNNEEILDAAWISLKVAVINAWGAVILGSLAGFVLARFTRFRGRFTLNAMTTAPLVMPEVITGLSLLLLFVAMEQLIGWPAGRGITSRTIAPITVFMD